MPEQEAIAKIVARVGDLPAMPSMVAHVLRITDNPNTAMSEVSAALETDPAMTAKILRVSNSSYYGMKQVVGTLKLALVILGVREVRNIVLGISVFEAMKGSDNGSGAIEDIWNRSLMVAGMGKRMSGDMGIGLQGEEFIAGLLSDIGKMVMFGHLGADYRGIYEKSKNHPEALCLAEVENFGYTHADVATALAHKWNLPPTLTDALWHQYADPARPIKNAKEPKLAAVVRIAKAAASDDFDNGTRMTCLIQTDAWDALDNAKSPVPADQRKDYMARCMKDIKAAGVLPL